ncbi:glycine oxidase ThiO [Paenibacillus kandeliae]|uniref:glycine oxidase ThiO n=1 Tax=Paenibacillus kandeliae TaxID=3231269 RepID=UPI0034577EF6
MRNKGKYDVIVVGAGAIGAAIALECQSRGASVAIVEKQHPAAGASGAAGGMLAASSEHFAHPDLQRLALSSRSLYPALAQRLHDCTGIDIGLRSEGFLLPIEHAATTSSNSEHISSAYSESDVYSETSQQQELEWWDSQRLAVVEPYIRADRGMMYNRHEMQLIPRLLTEALVGAAISTGVAMYRDHDVIRLLREPGHQGMVRGVVTDDAVLYGEHVVLASGLGTARLLTAEHWRLPFIPVKGELIELRTPTPWLHHTVYGEQVYLIPKHGHRIWVGATSKPGQRDTTFTAGAVMELLMKGQRYIPRLAEGELLRCWAGVRPGTPDELPYLGAVPQMPRLWIASGHYRNGILLAAGTAKWMADGIAGRGNAAIPSCFHPERALHSLKDMNTPSVPIATS